MFPSQYKNLIPTLPLYSPLRLTQMRKKIYLTQEAAAELTRVKVATWRHWESGRHDPPEVAWAYFVLNVFRPIRKALKEKHKYLDLVEQPDNW